MITLTIAPPDAIAPLPGCRALGQFDYWQARCGDTVPTTNGVGMVVHRLDVDLHSGYAASIVVTGDGGQHDDSAWHCGPETGPPVYVERIAAATGTRLFHGWIDPGTRRLVQTG